MSRETAVEIDAAAARWVARMDRGDLTADEGAALEAWLAGDVRRVGAFGKASAVAVTADRAAAFGGGRELGARRPDPSRRRLLIGGGLAASVAGLATFGLVATGSSKSYATERGETRRIPLDDGSAITLNTQSRVQVSESMGRRLVRLDRGEVLLDVAADSRRIVRLEAGPAQARTLGASVLVRRLPDEPVELLVKSGVVEVAAARQAGDWKKLGANTRCLAADGEIVLASLDPAAVDRELAWRDGQIAFNGDTLGQAAAQFARYSNTHIVFADPAIAGEQITGLFRADDPTGFAKAVAVSLDLRAEASQGRITLAR